MPLVRLDIYKEYGAYILRARYKQGDLESSPMSLKQAERLASELRRGRRLRRCL